MKIPRFLVYVLVLQAIVCITLVLDIPIVRQVLGFLYLTFVPGFVLLRGFKLEKSNMAETILFSAGFSITFLMFIGLLINELGPSFFIPKPLSTELLTIIISISVFFMSILSCVKNKEDFHVMVPKDLSIPNLVPYFTLPLLSIIGVMLVNAFENNLLLISIIIIISILFVLGSFSKFSSPYPFALVSISATLLLNTFLISNYIHGYDIHLEYYIFKETKNISYWNLSFGRDLYYSSSYLTQYIYNSMLSVTVLPTVFSNILNIEEIWIFKVIYPLIFSLVPLGLYQLYQRQWGKKAAFMSVLFFMSNSVFFFFRNTVKAMTAELFYVLLFLVLLKKDMNQQSKGIILMCFHFSLIVSYYTMNYIFLFLIFSTWLCANIFSKNKDKKINSVIVVFFFVLTFLWYLYALEAPFDTLPRFLKYTFQDVFEDFFYPQSRGGRILTAMGILSSPSFLHNIGKILYNVTVLFILIGFITFIAKRKKESLDLEYFVLTSLNMVPLLMAIIIPNFAYALQMDRLYHVSLLFLSPLFILGGRTFFENMFKILPLKKEKKKESYSLVLILTVMLAFFLFQTGFVYEITGDPIPSSISLSKYRMDDYTSLNLGLVNENDFFGATWLSRFVDVENTQIYSDVKAKYHVLTSTMINRNNRIVVLSNTTVFTSVSHIYLSRYNTMSEILLYDTRYPNNIQYNINELSIFNSTIVFNNKVYSNGACESYYYAP